MIEYWVGVDGGGTHTRARIRDRAGKLLGEGRAAGSNLELGIAHAHANVLAAIASARITAGLGIESEQQMGVGLALASAELADCYHAMLEMPFPFASVRLTSDAFGACLGAFGGREGAILIAGTGSVGLVYQEGQIRTCSGRGFPISDIGSGAWLGLRAIQQSLLCHDGILPPSTLAVRLLDRFKRDQAEVVRWAARAIPADYGHFAPWVFDAASDGDELANQLL
ncbi:MAG: BadF/BadG/BcrA/BcrD ATPase family protein, partial [Aeromonas sobria]